MEPDPRLKKKEPEPETLPSDTDKPESPQEEARRQLPGLRELADDAKDGMTMIYKRNGVEIGRTIIRKK